MNKIIGYLLKPKVSVGAFKDSSVTDFLNRQDLVYFSHSDDFLDPVYKSQFFCDMICEGDFSSLYADEAWLHQTMQFYLYDFDAHSELRLKQFYEKIHFYSCLNDARSYRIYQAAVATLVEARLLNQEVTEDWLLRKIQEIPEFKENPLVLFTRTIQEDSDIHEFELVRGLI